MTYTNEITNLCNCELEDDDGNIVIAEYCHGCWEDSLYEFAEATKDIVESNGRGLWEVDGLPLWNGSVSGIAEARSAEDLLRAITVRGEWILRYSVTDGELRCSLSHHDAPMGGRMTVRAHTGEVDE
jgi:hypothetical protein